MSCCEPAKPCAMITTGPVGASVRRMIVIGVPWTTSRVIVRPDSASNK